MGLGVIGESFSGTCELCHDCLSLVRVGELKGDRYRAKGRSLFFVCADVALGVSIGRSCHGTDRRIPWREMVQFALLDKGVFPFDYAVLNKFKAGLALVPVSQIDPKGRIVN